MQNENIIHLNKENENANDSNDENRDKGHDDLLAVNAFVDEAKSRGLRRDQRDSTSEPDDTGDKILNQEVISKVVDLLSIKYFPIEPEKHLTNGHQKKLQ